MTLPKTSPINRQWGTGAAVILVFIIALVFRLLPWEHVFSNGRIYYYDPDCYMRLRKILVYLASFPSTAIHDYFQGFPQGTGVITPPTMEYLLAALARPFRSSPLLIPAIERVIAVIPPLTGAVTAAILCRFTAGIAGLPAGLAAGLVLAVIPAHIEATILGRFDNEMVEPLFLLLAFWSYLKTMHGDENLRPWLMAGVAAMLYLSIWRGGIAFLALIGVDLLFRLWSERKDHRKCRITGNAGAIMYLTTALFLALICLTDLWGSRQLFSFNIISWFHVILFAGAGVTILAVSRGFEKSCVTGLIYGGGAALLLLILLQEQLLSGFSLMRGGNAWLDSIVQYQRNTDLTAFIRGFGLVSLLLPFGLLLLTRQQYENLKERRLLIIWGVVMLIAAIARQRFSEYLALNIALASGICMAWIAPFIRPQWFAVAVMLASLFVLQIPALLTFTALKEQKVADVFRGDVEETMQWLREKTPPAGDPYRPDQKPAYGVLARWDYGGWIETVAQRPSLATNYGTETYGMEEAARCFLATDEKELDTLLKRNGIKYLVVDNLMTDLRMYAGLIGSEADLFSLQRDTRTGLASYVPRPQLYQLIVSRLFYADGTSAAVQSFHFAPVEGLRLMFESSSPALVTGLPWQVPKIKVFEYAPGALLSIKTAPGREVTLSQPVETNRGRRFVYRNSKIADSGGDVHFRVVYLPKNGAVSGATGPVEIVADGNRRVVAVAATDIETQKQIKIRF